MLLGCPGNQSLQHFLAITERILSIKITRICNRHLQSCGSMFVPIAAASEHRRREEATRAEESEEEKSGRGEAQIWVPPVILLTGILKYHSGILKRSHQVQHGISIVSGGDILKYLDITLFFLNVPPLYVGIQYILFLKRNEHQPGAASGFGTILVAGFLVRKITRRRRVQRTSEKEKRKKKRKEKEGGLSRLHTSPSKPRVASSFPSAHARD